MSQFYDQASLVMVPSGYKNGKVYSQKPLSTDGELTFTRSNDTATRVNSSGLIEKVRTNVALYSNDFSNAAWAKLDNATVSGIRVADPFGGNTAWQVIFDGSSNGRIEQTIGSLINNGTYTTSFYLRVASGTVSAFVINDAVTITTTWQRFSSIETITGTDAYPRLRCNTAATIQVYAGQFELSDFGATDYIATTSAAVSVGPVANLPRLDYSGGCPSLLLEPQRTNLLQYSDGLVPAQAFGATLTKNSIVSPDGYQNASLFTPSGGAGGVTLMTSSFSGYYTISVYLKGSVNGQKVRAFGDLQSTIIDWTITTEWVRYTATFNATNPTGQSIYLLAGSYFTPSQNNPFYVYGAQIEAGAYATSYIPTIAATTRGAEVCNLLSMSSGVASGATAGTLFIELEHKLNSTAGDSFVFGQTNGTFPAGRGYIYAADSGFADSFGGGGFAIPQSQTVKMIFRMNSLSNANIFQNGVKGATVSGTAWAAINSIQFRGAYASMKVKQILFSKSALTDAQCIELTTL